MDERFGYGAPDISEYAIHPSVVGFSHCDISTCFRPKSLGKRILACIGVLYDTVQKQSELESNSASEVIRIMSLLGEASRFNIISRLLEGPTYVGELAKCVNLAPCTVSQRLSTLGEQSWY